MKKIFKLLFAVLLESFLCGCFLFPQTPNNNPNNPPINTNPPVSNQNTNPTGDSGVVNIYVRGSMYDSGKVFSPEHPTYRTMGKSVCEYEGNVYFGIGNCVYKQSPEGDMEKIFESDEVIYSFLGIWKDKVLFAKENGKDIRDFYLNNFWVYDCQTGNTKQITDLECSKYYATVYENYLFVYNGRLLCYDIESDQETLTDNISTKTEEEWKNYLPDSFIVKKYNTKNNSLGEELYKIENDKEIPLGIVSYIVDNKYLNFGGVGNRFSEYKWVYYNKNIYTISVYPKFEDAHAPLPGTDEICDTQYWEKDVLSIADSKNLDPVKVTDVYEDSVNRIVGYNPDTNEVYLYVFDNNTLTAKNLDDSSETVIETFDNAETIEFEWCDTRLYWFYVKNGSEEYGGVHEFAE